MDDWEARLSRRPEPLSWALAVMGVTAGLFVDDIGHALRHVSYRCNSPVRWFPTSSLALEDRVAIAGLLGLSFFVSGAVLARSLKDGRRIGWSTPPVVVFAAFVAGVLSLLLTHDAIIFAIVAVGTVVPFCVVAAYGATRAWDVRAGTPAHRLFRRIMWLGATAHATIILGRLARRALEEPGYLERDVYAAAGLAVVGCVGLLMLVMTVVDWRRLRTLERAISTRRARADGATELHDLGLGDEELKIMAPGKNPYRDTDKLLAHVRGDSARLFRALVLGGAGLAVALMGLLFSLGVPLGTHLACL